MAGMCIYHHRIAELGMRKSVAQIHFGLQLYVYWDMLIREKLKSWTEYGELMFKMVKLEASHNKLEQPLYL